MINLSLTEDQAFTAIRTFLLAVLAPGTEVIQAQTNRVPEPFGTDFVVMTKSMRERLETNIDSYADALFTGSITGTTLNISAVTYGSLSVGSTIFGAGIAANTTITAFGTGIGGIGSYTISPSQNISSEKIAAGVFNSLQPVKFTVQLDIHGDLGADNAHIISTLFRDDYGVQLFKSSGFDVTPLYATEAKQLPFLNGEQQIESRWTMDIVVQCNPVVTVPQQFADQLAINIINVDAIYPP